MGTSDGKEKRIGWMTSIEPIDLVVDMLLLMPFSAPCTVAFIDIS